jgi:hypothetical protein
VGKPGRKIITNGFRSTRLLRQERLRKSAAYCKTAGQKAARASQANGAVGLAGLQNQNKWFWVPIEIEFFRARKLRFLEKTFDSTTNIEFWDEHFGTFGKIINFSVRE